MVARCRHPARRRHARLRLGHPPRRPVAGRRRHGGHRSRPCAARDQPRPHGSGRGPVRQRTSTTILRGDSRRPSATTRRRVLHGTVDHRGIARITGLAALLPAGARVVHGRQHHPRWRWQRPHRGPRRRRHHRRRSVAERRTERGQHAVPGPDDRAALGGGRGNDQSGIDQHLPLDRHSATGAGSRRRGGVLRCQEQLCRHREPERVDHGEPLRRDGHRRASTRCGTSSGSGSPTVPSSSARPTPQPPARSPSATTRRRRTNSSRSPRRSSILKALARITTTVGSRDRRRLDAGARRPHVHSV